MQKIFTHDDKIQNKKQAREKLRCTGEKIDKKGNTLRTPKIASLHLISLHDD